MTTIETLSDEQIRDIETEAYSAGDYVMAAIAGKASRGTVSAHLIVERLDDAQVARVRAMGQGAALRAVVVAINSAEARQS